MQQQIFDRITVDEAVCNGKPVFRGKRITVQTVLEFLSAGDSAEDLLKQYPSLEMEDIQAALKFAAYLIDRSYIINAVENEEGMWKDFSAGNFLKGYAENEPDYTEANIKEPNPEYKSWKEK